MDDGTSNHTQKGIPQIMSFPKNSINNTLDGAWRILFVFWVAVMMVVVLTVKSLTWW